MPIFSTAPITTVYEIHRSPIVSTNIDPNRDYDASIGFHYDLGRSTGLGMREEVLRIIDLAPDVVGHDGKLMELFVDRGSSDRNRQNLEELHRLMLDTCAHCEVEAVRFHTMCAPAIVGFHGSGLAHVVWMAEPRLNDSTHLVEVLPSK
jgi:hypothetical protein